MKKTTKLLSIFLALIMCLGALPITAFADTYYRIHIQEVVPPVAGKNAKWDWVSFNKIVKWEDSDGDTCYWSETDSVPTKYSEVKKGNRRYKSQGNFKFLSNKYYTFVAYANPERYYYFASNCIAYINDIECHFEKAADGDCWIIWYVFGKPTAPITNIEITGVSEPEARKNPRFDFNIPSGAHYSIDDYDSLTWVETDTKPSTNEDLENGVFISEDNNTFKFKKDKYYSFMAYVKPDTLYDYSDRLTATVNGHSANIYDFGSSFNYRIIWYCFGLPASTPLSYISVTTPPTKTTYTAGQNFDKSGMVVTAYYQGGTFETITNYTLSSAYGLYVGQTGVSISYTEGGVTKTTTVPITVTSATKTLSSISVTTQPTKKNYTAGQNFDKSGMVVKANYSNGTSSTITNYTVTNGTNLPAGRTSVTISYTEGGVTKTTTVPITVTASTKTLTSIEVGCQPTKKNYIAGENFDKSGLRINAYYSNGACEGVTSKIVITNGNNLPAGRTSVTVSYTEGGVTKTTTVPITVTASSATLTGIEITSVPNTTELKYKSSASTDGLQVIAKYSNGTTKDVTSQVKVKDFSATNKKGNYTATVEYEGMTATFNYNVKYSFGQWLIIIFLFGWIWY